MIRLLKSWTGLRKYPRGQVLKATKNLEAKLIRQGIAIEYTGEYPPKKKMKNKF